MSDAEVLERAMNGEFVGAQYRYCGVMAAEILRLRATAEAFDAVVKSLGLDPRVMDDGEKYREVVREVERCQMGMALARQQLKSERARAYHPAVVEAVVNVRQDMNDLVIEEDNARALDAFLMRDEMLSRGGISQAAMPTLL